MGFLILPIYSLLFWLTVQLPLMILNSTFNVVNFFNSQMIIALIFPGGDFSFKNITPFFEIVLYIVGFIGIFALIGKWVLLTIRSNATTYEKIVKSLRSLFFACVLIFVVPVMFWIYAHFNLIVNKGIKQANLVGTFNLANIVYHISIFQPSSSFTEVVDYSANNFAITPSALINFNFIVAWAGIFFSFKLIIRLVEIILFSIIWLFVLFVIAPYVALCMVLDKPTKVVEWKNSVIQKFIENFAANFMIILFSFLLGSMMNILSKQNELVGFSIQIIILFVLIGLANTVSPIVDWISKQIVNYGGMSILDGSLRERMWGGFSALGGFAKNTLLGKEKQVFQRDKNGTMSLITKRSGGLVGKVAKTGLNLAKGAALGGGLIGLAGSTGKVIARNAASNMFQGSKLGATMGFINKNKKIALQERQHKARVAAGKLAKSIDKKDIDKRNKYWNTIKKSNNKLKKIQLKIDKRNAYKEK
ncbi:Mbov_0396 family ICE element transmembrane protein [Mycoplasma capricolum]|uniref:Mbov_0396 family ICE element transmembrane protein n=1 Tax=Mycoplasma capricolum TaxID=2095 RepID=UPI0022F3C93A|nr:hypothetical protein [Mycoplasma capricolum]WBX36249.1 hypothetical protein NO343_04845 [Mycoplasma capricolum subsp. capricolum]